MQIWRQLNDNGSIPILFTMRMLVQRCDLSCFSFQHSRLAVCSVFFNENVCCFCTHTQYTIFYELFTSFFSPRHESICFIFASSIITIVLSIALVLNGSVMCLFRAIHWNYTTRFSSLLWNGYFSRCLFQRTLFLRRKKTINFGHLHVIKWIECGNKLELAIRRVSKIQRTYPSINHVEFNELLNELENRSWRGSLPFRIGSNVSLSLSNMSERLSGCVCACDCVCMYMCVLVHGICCRCCWCCCCVFLVISDAVSFCFSCLCHDHYVSFFFLSLLYMHTHGAQRSWFSSARKSPQSDMYSYTHSTSTQVTCTLLIQTAISGLSDCRTWRWIISLEYQQILVSFV